MAAIPVDFANQNPQQFIPSDPDVPGGDGTNWVGMKVTWSVLSDSGYARDLDQVQISEVIALVSETSLLLNVLEVVFPLQHSGNMSAVEIATGVISDFHIVIKTKLKYSQFLSEQSSLYDQAFKFKDARTGGIDLPVRNSGFEVSFTALTDKRTGKLKLIVTKLPAHVVVGKISTNPGFTYPTSPLTITQFVSL